MDSLKERILKDGMALNETVLKVDSVLGGCPVNVRDWNGI